MRSDRVMGDGSRTRRPVATGALVLAAVAVVLLGAQAIADRWVEVVNEGSVAAVLDDEFEYATLVTTPEMFRELEAGLVDGDRLPAAGPPLLVVGVLQKGAGSWCTSATAEVTTAADGTIQVVVTRPWWRSLPTLHCIEDVPAPSGLIVALDEQELAAAPAVELTGWGVTPAPPRDIIRCTPGEGTGESGWVCLDELR